MTTKCHVFFSLQLGNPERDGQTHHFAPARCDGGKNCTPHPTAAAELIFRKTSDVRKPGITNQLKDDLTIFLG
jgi:hypothetical protein